MCRNVNPKSLLESLTPWRQARYPGRPWREVVGLTGSHVQYRAEDNTQGSMRIGDALIELRDAEGVVMRIPGAGDRVAA